jgi:hypothetical protein
MSRDQKAADAELTSYQSQFGRALLEGSQPGSVHFLVAPVGAGKSFAIASGILDLSSVDRATRVLVLTPAALVAQWVDVIGRLGGDSVGVDGRDLRLLRESAGLSGGVWPNGIFVMSIDLAKRADVRDVILGQEWSVVVIDEAHSLVGQRLSLAEELGAERRGGVVILTSPLACAIPEGLRSRAKLTDWGQVLGTAARKAAGMPRRLVRSFKSKEGEVEVARKVLSLARKLGSPRGLMLLRLAASSILALEDSLVRSVEAGQLPSDIECEWEQLLQEVEELDVDSRIECLLEETKKRISGGARHVVVFSDFRATIQSIDARMEEAGIQRWLLHLGLPEEQRLATVQRFQESGGLLLLTSAALQGIELPPLAAVVHHDLPMSPRGFALRESRYLVLGREPVPTIVLLCEASGENPVDRFLPKIIEQSGEGEGWEDTAVEGELWRAVVSHGQGDVK